MPVSTPPAGAFWSLTLTGEETSLVCPTDQVPEGFDATNGWRAICVKGPLDFSLVGVLAGLTGTLAAAEISVFAMSTFDTDYLLVRGESLDEAIVALRTNGHSISGF